MSSATCAIAISLPAPSRRRLPERLLCWPVWAPGARCSAVMAATIATAAAVAIVAAITAEHRAPGAHTGQHSNRSGKRRRDGAGKDIAIAHVAELMGQDAFQLLVVQEPQDSLRY